MQAVSDDTVRAFTIGTNGDPLDESSDATTYAQEIGVDHIVEHITPDQSLEMLHDVIAACGEPFADYSIFPTTLVCRLARRHVKVMLSGDGGDELFWGYTGLFASVLKLTTDLAQRSGMPEARWNVKKLFAAGTQLQDPRWPGSLGDSYRLKHTVSEGWLRLALPDLPPWPADFSLFTYSGWEPDQIAQWLRWNEFKGFLTMVLLKVDRASMYHSLEVRVPLLDREVIDVASRVDWRSCMDVERQIGKLPLRRALARQVRHQTWTKRGFNVPMGIWLRGPLRPVFEERVLRRKEILGLPLDTKAIREIFERHLCEQAHYDRGLWVLLSLSLWEEQHYRARYRLATSTLAGASQKGLTS